MGGAAVLVTVILLLITRGPATGGPLAGPGSYGYSIVVKPGGSFVDAFNVIRATGPRKHGATATLIAVQADYATDALRTQHVWATTTRTGTMQASYRGDRPHGHELGTLAPVNGTGLYTERANPWGTQILIATKVLRPGHFLRRGFWLTYRQGSHTWRDYVDAEITVCTPDHTRHGRCPFLGTGAD